MRRTRVYVSGPISNGGGGVDLHKVHEAIHVGDKLRRLGFSPHVPHLTVLWDMVVPTPYTEWLEMDNAWVLASDVLIRLPGESKGADKEVAWAREVHIPVWTMPIEVDDRDWMEFATKFHPTVHSEARDAN